MAKNGVIAIDFDGVIGDSVKECFVQSVKAYSNLGGKIKTTAETEKQFREARPLTTQPEQFLSVLRLMEQNPKIDFRQMTQQTMNNEFQKDKKRGKLFNQKFKEHRKEMQKISPKEWFALQRSFPRVAKFVRKLQAGNKVFIATTKDSKSVSDLLKRYGISIPEKNIVAREFSSDKRKQLQEIAFRAGVPIKKIVLLDDAIEQVRGAREIGAKGIIAPWGYITRGQQKQAKKERIPIIKGKFGPSQMAGKKIARIARRAGK